jgi:RNA recognition motif-containing protein
MSVNIYVGNIPYSMSETQMKELFSQYGEVASVKIITDPHSGQSKGFGFVEMAKKEDAENAIQQLNGKDVSGRNIKVNLAKPRTESNNRFNKRY